MAIRKRLISDPKYQHVNINVDDDYEEAHNQGKNLGLINFKRISPKSPVKIPNNNSNINYNYNNMNSNGNLPLTNFNNMNQNNMNNMASYPLYNNQHLQSNQNYNQTPQNYQQQPNFQNGVYHQQQNNYPVKMQNNVPFVQSNNNYYPQDQSSNNPSNFVSNPSPKNKHPENVLDISVSYKNYELDEDKKRQEKNILAQALRSQMDEKERLKKLD